MAVPARTNEAVPYVKVSCVDATGTRRRRPLLDCATAKFEDVVPVRPFRWSQGSRHFPGWYWSATTGQHIGFESWLERDHQRARIAWPLTEGQGAPTQRPRT